jgi:hypothetical protein
MPKRTEEQGRTCVFAPFFDNHSLFLGSKKMVSNNLPGYLYQIKENFFVSLQ